MALAAHDSIPHFEIPDVDNRTVRYRDVWQQNNLLLIALPTGMSDADACYVAELRSRMDELSAHETTCVITRAAIPGVPQPGVVIADRWGEIHWVSPRIRVEELPPASELIEWLRYVQMQCPECQGEAR